MIEGVEGEMKNLTDHREILYAAGAGSRVVVKFKDRASLRRWQTAFNSARRREELKIAKAWMEDMERGLTPTPPVLPWEKVRTWTGGNGLTLIVGVPLAADLGILEDEA